MVRAMLNKEFYTMLVNMVDAMIRHKNSDHEVEQEVQNFFLDIECPMPWTAVKEFVKERQFNAVIDSWLERG